MREVTGASTNIVDIEAAKTMTDLQIVALKKDVIYRLVQQAGGNPLKSDTKHLLVVKLTTELESVARRDAVNNLPGGGEQVASGTPATGTGTGDEQAGGGGRSEVGTEVGIGGTDANLEWLNNMRELAGADERVRQQEEEGVELHEQYDDLFVNQPIDPAYWGEASGVDDSGEESFQDVETQGLFRAEDVDADRGVVEAKGAV